MRGTVAAIAVGLLGAVLTGLAFFWAYDNTLTRHDELPARAVTTVVVEGELRNGAEDDLEMTIRGLVAACLPEVRGHITAPGIDDVGEGRFAFRVRPGLDDADRRQLRGCLEDWRIDHLLVDVLVLETDLGPGE